MTKTSIVFGAVVLCVTTSTAHAQQRMSTEATLARAKDATIAAIRDAERKVAESGKVLQDHKDATDVDRGVANVQARGGEAVRNMPGNVRDAMRPDPASKANAAREGLQDFAAFKEAESDLGGRIIDADKNNRRTAELRKAHEAAQKELEFVQAVDKQVDDVTSDYKNGRIGQNVTRQCKDTLAKAQSVVSDREARRQAERAAAAKAAEDAKKDRDRRGIERATEPGRGRINDAPREPRERVSNIA